MATVKIVALGGGTGLSVLLRGLKKVTNEITAIVTVGDDGGGSGVLREDLGMLPPGDIRSCLLALSNAEPTFQSMIQYRFKEGRLKGQNLGNLMIAALNDISGGFEEAVERFSDIFAITGQVLPVATKQMTLMAELTDGSIAEGESNIPIQAIEKNQHIKKIWVEPENLVPPDKAVEAICEADIILLGPGSLYTSVIPNLKISAIVEAVNASKGTKVYVSNIMTQPGETHGFTTADHVKAIFNNTQLKAIDYVIANDTHIDLMVEQKYADEMSRPVVTTEKDTAFLLEKNIKIISNDYTEVKKGYIRHDAIKIAKELIRLGYIGKEQTE